MRSLQQQALLPDLTRWRLILRLALPIMAGMLSQSLMNLVDAALVGRLGETELAAAGIGGYAMFMVTACLFGLSSGVQAQVARRHGERHQTPVASAAAELGVELRHDPRGEPLAAGLTLAVMIGLPLMVLCLWQAGPIMAWLNDDPRVTSMAVDYFRWRLIALLPVAMIFCYRGYWNGIQQTGLYLRIMLVMHLVNLLASIGLIFGYWGLPAMGVSGAGLGSSLSLFAGVAIWAWLSHTPGHRGTRHRPCHSPWRLGGSTMATTLKLATPHSFQQLWFAAGYAVLFWILGQVDTASVAVGHVLVNLSLLLILPGVGLGMAAMSLVGEALGRESPERAHRWGWEVVHMAWLLLAALSLPMALMPEAVLGLFLHDPELIALGVDPLRLTALMIVLDAAALVFTQALLGAGANRTVMQLTLTGQWLVFLPLAWWFGVHEGFGLAGIWWCQLGYRALNSLCFAVIWQRRRWQSLKV
ncbi:MATE family efflux transporter [Halomonas sp. DN3]|uniref:MATE family efflux transporter n=1 Tax=Halomonas sp. DN3 TaxID=2953657 RepID=UPI00209DE81F|nr:MATE family efflux transporter [Halomonas sp. DN3]USZ51834.1 MATE family efflux transporter [Halomonas sp. DN3]